VRVILHAETGEIQTKVCALLREIITYFSSLLLLLDDGDLFLLHQSASLASFPPSSLSLTGPEHALIKPLRLSKRGLATPSRIWRKSKFIVCCYRTVKSLSCISSNSFLTYFPTSIVTTAVFIPVHTIKGLNENAVGLWMSDNVLAVDTYMSQSRWDTT
jgi:hypothetical protein